MMLGASFGVFVMLLLAYNYATTGHPFVTGYQLLNPAIFSLQPFLQMDSQFLRILLQM